MIWNCKLGRATFVFSFISPSSFVPQLVAQFSFHHLLLFSVSFLFQQLYRIQIIPFHITERFSLICGFNFCQSVFCCVNNHIGFLIHIIIIVHRNTSFLIVQRGVALFFYVALCVKNSSSRIEFGHLFHDYYIVVFQLIQ